MGRAAPRGSAVLAGLIEAIINRVADVIERVSADLDAISAEVFTRPTSAGAARARDFQAVLERVGQSGELIAKTRESLVSLGRALAFVQQASSVNLANDVRTRLRTQSRDVIAMSDHASFLGNNVSFILDATLGMVNIDQNNILKIFSVVTVFLLPPSVIGAIYGMNFDHIPWAHESWGFMAALGLMVASALASLPVFQAPRLAVAAGRTRPRLQVILRAAAPVAQLDRVAASEAAGRGFESRRARHFG